MQTMTHMRPQIARHGGDAKEFLRCFAGIWSVRRVIVDHRADATYRFTGILRLTEETFHETGEMKVRCGTVAAERVYRLRSQDTAVEIVFPDGRSFVTLDLRASQTVRHDCGADLYLGRLVFRSIDAFAERWRVSGPAKRYSSLCHYGRLGEP